MSELMAGGLVSAGLRDTPLAIYPGQNPYQVLAVADVLMRELAENGVEEGLARHVARKVLLALDRQK